MCLVVRLGGKQVGPGPGQVSQPGVRWQQAAAGLVPSLRPPRLLCPSEKKEEDKEQVARWPHWADSAGRKGQGLKESQGCP